jgi:integrase
MRDLAAAFAEGRAEIVPDGTPRILWESGASAEARSAKGEAPSPAPSTALAVVHAPGSVSMTLPSVIADAGETAARFTFEFFTARIPNAHTRKAYGRAVFAFCKWCEAEGVALRALTPPTLSAYLEGLRVSPASVKLTASALRHWLDYLTQRGVLTHNPALSVRTARLVVKEGKTPVLERAEAKRLFLALDEAVKPPVEETASTDGSPAGEKHGDLLALRDRALFGIMLYGFVRVGAAVRMTVRDFDDSGEHAALVLHEKGGKERRIPCHHKAREYLRAYIAAVGFEPRAKLPLFQSAPGRSGKLSGEAMTIDDALRAVKRRCADAGLPRSISNHSFRATGITLHQQNDGRLEEAQDLAGHADARTTRLYIRKNSATAQAEVERVQL